jgi:hypothetical protein
VLADLFVLLSTVPATFWGVVAGAFFSLAGVWLTNRAGDKRLARQFAHEHDKLKKDREMSLRKDIYLSAAEAIAMSMKALGGFANPDMGHADIVQFHEKSGVAIAKVPIVGSTKTIEALQNFSNEMSAAFFRLAIPHSRLVAIKQQIAGVDRLTAASFNERDRLLEMMKQYNFDGSSDDRKWEFLTHSFRSETSSIESRAAERNNLVQQLLLQQLAVLNECIAQTEALSEILVPVISAVREELELPFDEQTYRQGLATGMLKLTETVDTFVKALTGARDSAQPTPSPD